MFRILHGNLSLATNALPLRQHGWNPKAVEDYSTPNAGANFQRQTTRGASWIAVALYSFFAVRANLASRRFPLDGVVNDGKSFTSIAHDPF